MKKYLTSTELQIIKDCLMAVYNTIEKDENGDYTANYENFFYHNTSKEEIQALKTLAENY